MIFLLFGNILFVLMEDFELIEIFFWFFVFCFMFFVVEGFVVFIYDVFSFWFDILVVFLIGFLGS